MRVLHVAYAFDPDPIGGTEVYVKQLIGQLERSDIESAVAAPGKEAKYFSGKLPVYRFQADSNLTYDSLYGKGDSVALKSFKNVLTDFKPELVHFHSVSPANSYLLFEYCKQQQLPVILTLHTPAMVCQRGDLLYEGKYACDNFSDPKRCSVCYLQKLTKNKTVARLADAVSGALPRGCFQGVPGGIGLMLNMRALMQRRINGFRRISLAVEKIICPAKWVMKVLLENQLPAVKLIFSRQGINFDPAVQYPKKTNFKKFIFLARLDPIKGLDILLEAFKKVTDPDLRLDLYVIVQFKDTYLKKIRSCVEKDARVQIKTAVSSREVVPLIAGYDAVIVPSQCLETGPLVALEALAAQVPVIGSELGTLREIIEDEKNGFLVKEYASSDAWTSKIKYLCESPHLIEKVRAQFKNPKSIREVADEMVLIYRSILKK